METWRFQIPPHGLRASNVEVDEMEKVNWEPVVSKRQGGARYIANLWPCRTQVLQSFAWPMRWLKATQTEIAKENNEVSSGRDFSCWSP